jgi:16S rRNA (cytosine967-C5)-methyltransferase
VENTAYGSFDGKQGLLIAMDLYESKLKQLKIRAKETEHLISNTALSTLKVIKLHQKADRVLIDAPCSGLGVLKRNPDAKWKLKPEFIDNMRKIQAEVLESYSKIVKPGGKWFMLLARYYLLKIKIRSLSF